MNVESTLSTMSTFDLVLAVIYLFTTIAVVVSGIYILQNQLIEKTFPKNHSALRFGLSLVIASHLWSILNGAPNTGSEIFGHFGIFIVLLKLIQQYNSGAFTLFRVFRRGLHKPNSISDEK